jgi:hypothetical protein
VHVVESAADFAAVTMAQLNSGTPQINDNSLVSRGLGKEKFDVDTYSFKTSQQIVAELFSFEHYLKELGAIVERVLP